MQTNDNRPRVLIVEDDRSTRVGLAELVRALGFTADAAADGDEALAKFTDFRPSIVVSDLVMPRMGGLDLLRALQPDLDDVTFVLLTAQGTVETAVEAMKSGAYDYLTKPFSLGQLDVVLQRIHDRVALEEENRRLSRRSAARDAGEGRPLVMGRLDAIDARLSKIEALLQAMSTKG